MPKQTDPQLPAAQGPQSRIAIDTLNAKTIERLEKRLGYCIDQGPGD